MARVGGLAAAAGGLVAELRAADVDVEVVLPDYRGRLADARRRTEVSTRRARVGGPGAAAPARWRASETDADRRPGDRQAPSVPGADGKGWPDNDRRFMAFSAAVAALTDVGRAGRAAPQRLAHVRGARPPRRLPPTMLTIHTLAYQGRTQPRLAEDRCRTTSPRSSSGATATRCSAASASPTWSSPSARTTPTRSRTPAGRLRSRRAAARHAATRSSASSTASTPTSGIRRPTRTCRRNYSTRTTLGGKGVDPRRAARRARPARRRRAAAGDGHPARRPEGCRPRAAARAVPERSRRALVVLGDGRARRSADALDRGGRAHPQRVAFVDGYDEALAHQLFAGGDVFLMPSRFEPCGLAQMQAMRYGTLPVVTDVGGLARHRRRRRRDPDARARVSWRRQPTGRVLDAMFRVARCKARLAAARRSRCSGGA